MDEPVGNRVRMHRKNAGLSQYELGKLLGYGDDGQVSRHERSRSLPTFLMALSYQCIFCVRIAELFGGLHESVAQSVEGRIAELEKNLRQRDAGTARAAATARKFEWLQERRSRSYAHR
jgi:DNA-binding XRE family transcriptional regulator